MRLLTKIIGKAPSELGPDELMDLTKRNRARIRREIKEYRKLRAAIQSESPKRSIGRPVGKKSALAQDKELLALAKQHGVSMTEILETIKSIKELKA